nr:DUF305 domain-containing protein [Micromonospora krabiensis]
MTRTVVRRAALAGVVVTTAVTLAACGGGDHSPGMGHGSSSVPGGVPGGAAFNDADVAFAQMMIPHHRQAVEMAELAATRAEDPEIARLAGQIKAAQAPEIAAMTGWLAAWGRPLPSAGPEMSHLDHGMPGMMAEAELRGLEAASGRAFDRQFLTMMIAHHEGAVAMARDEIADGGDPAAKALAQQVVAAQQAEIATMREILDRL